MGDTMTNSATSTLLTGAAIGAVCLVVGTMIGSSLATPAAPTLGDAVDTSVENRLRALERNVESLARRRADPLIVERDMRSETTAPVEAVPQPLTLESSANLAPDLAQLAARINALEQIGPRTTALRSLDSNGMPSEQRPLQAERVLEMQSLSKDDLNATLVFMTREQVYALLGTPTTIDSHDTSVTWTYDTSPGLRDRRLHLILRDGTVIRAYATNT